MGCWTRWLGLSGHLSLDEAREFHGQCLIHHGGKYGSAVNIDQADPAQPLMRLDTCTGSPK
jgi:hypothetical protein